MSIDFDSVSGDHIQVDVYPPRTRLAPGTVQIRISTTLGQGCVSMITHEEMKRICKESLREIKAIEKQAAIAAGRK